MRFRLGDHLPYLLGRAGTAVATGFSRELDRFGISFPMWRVISALLAEGEMRLVDLSRTTAIELSTLSRITAAMDGKGLVSRRRSGTDARSVLIGLTPEGYVIGRSVVPRALDWESAATAGMSDNEIATLKALLNRLYGNAVAVQP